MEDYNKFLKDSIDYKKSREDRYKEVSKDALFKASKKKIQTTMIGALYSRRTFWFSMGV